MPGKIISLNAAVVEISTQRAESGLAVPSMIPGISRNCRRTSSTIPCAARPTAVIVSAATKNGRHPPRKRPITTSGSRMLIPLSCRPTLDEYAENRARAVRAADPIANPLPIAAVVFPIASSESVISLVSGPSPLISLIPPALSAIGP